MENRDKSCVFVDCFNGICCLQFSSSIFPNFERFERAYKCQRALICNSRHWRIGNHLHYHWICLCLHVWRRNIRKRLAEFYWNYILGKLYIMSFLYYCDLCAYTVCSFYRKRIPASDNWVNRFS